MAFFPSGYTPSTGGSSNYTKLQPGENKLRVISEDALLGWQYWNTAGKPVRFAHDKFPGNQPADIRDGETVKEVMWTAVYNYATKSIEIWEVTQKQILKALYDYAHLEDYGDPSNYGLTIKRDGSGKETKYSVLAGVPKPLPTEIKELADKTPINLANILTTGNAFDASPAPGAKPTAEQKKVLVESDENLPF